MAENRIINRKIFYASVVNHNGYPALMIRKIISDKKEIEKIISSILENGIYEIHGVLIFRNPILAINHLHQLGLIDKSFVDFVKKDFKFLE